MNQKSEQEYNNDELIDHLKGGRSVEFTGQIELDIRALSLRAQQEFLKKSDSEQTELDPSVTLLLDEIVSRIDSRVDEHDPLPAEDQELIKQWATLLEQRIAIQMQILRKEWDSLGKKQNDLPIGLKNRGHAGYVTPSTQVMLVQLSRGLQEAGYLTRFGEYQEQTERQTWQLPRWIQRHRSVLVRTADVYVRLISQLVQFSDRSMRNFEQQYLSKIKSLSNLWFCEPIQKQLLAKGMYPVEVDTSLSMQNLFDDRWHHDQSLTVYPSGNPVAELGYHRLTFPDIEGMQPLRYRCLIELITFDATAIGQDHVKVLPSLQHATNILNWMNAVEIHFDAYHLRPALAQELYALHMQYPNVTQIESIATPLTASFQFEFRSQFKRSGLSNAFIQPFRYKGDDGRYVSNRVLLPTSREESNVQLSEQGKQFWNITWFAGVVFNPATE